MESRQKVMKFLWVIPILAVLVIGYFYLNDGDVPKNSIEFVRLRTVKVIAEDIGQSGSGFLINSKGLIMTNFHLLSSPAVDGDKVIQIYSQNLKVIMPDGTVLNPSIVAGAGFSVDPRNSGYDFILLKVEITGNPYLDFADSDEIDDNDELNFAGYRLTDNSFEVGRGLVTDMFSFPQKGYQVEIGQLTNIDNGGLSGGPVLNDVFKIVGIMSMLDPTSQLKVNEKNFDEDDPQLSVIRTRSNMFGNMISQRTDVGYFILIKPLVRYLTEVGALPVK